MLRTVPSPAPIPPLSTTTTRAAREAWAGAAHSLVSPAYPSSRDHNRNKGESIKGGVGVGVAHCVVPRPPYFPNHNNGNTGVRAADEVTTTRAKVSVGERGVHTQEPSSSSEGEEEEDTDSEDEEGEEREGETSSGDTSSSEESSGSSSSDEDERESEHTQTPTTTTTTGPKPCAGTKRALNGARIMHKKEDIVYDIPSP